ncbi:hypothetical protein QSH57_005008 [Fusarium oxysporum f. sp. vasinfectum]|nr:hypothetical protein QSH57_005008 [Fusarium oxysporum f. sp. vasinfectum]
MAPYGVVLLGTLSILGFAASAQEAAAPEPQICFNFTYTEHLDKVAAASAFLRTGRTMVSRRRRAVAYRGVVAFSTLENVILSAGETQNDQVTNDMLQALPGHCVDRYGTGWRAANGTCNGQRRLINCGKPGVTGSDGNMYKDCPEGFECTTFQAVNFRTPRATFPLCGSRIRVVEKHDLGRHMEWEGTWYPEPPKSPGTYDSFAKMADSLNGYFDFGAYSNGEGFSSRGYEHSWSCIDCPGGKLTITSTDRATWAIGYASPH